MRDRLRSMASRLKDEVDRRRGTDVDDDPDAEALPTVAAVDPELSRLDEGEAPPVDLPDDVGLVELFGRIDPVPALPLTGPHEFGVSLLVQRLARIGEDLLADGRVRRVLALLGDRLSITVDQDGISVRGLVRTRHTPWKRIHTLTFTNRYEQFKGRLVTQMADDISGRVLRIPVPGLSWLLRRVIGGIGDLYERRRLSPQEVEELRVGLGHSLTGLERRGVDIELSGALRLVSFFSYGVSAAILHEARARGIPVTGVER